MNISSLVRRFVPFGLLCFWRLLKQSCFVSLALLKRNSTPLIVVYQMGKVGSISTVRAIKNAGLPSVFHAHRLNISHISARRAASRAKGWTIDAGDEIGLVLGRVLHLFPKVKIICPIREPVSRNVSDFFQNINRMSVDILSLSDEDMLRSFYKDNDHNIGDIWFDTELKEVTGIDVYDRPFNKSKGYDFYESGRFQCLVLYYDLPDKIKSALVSEFLQKTIEINHLHSSEGKGYANSYRRMKEAVVCDESYASQMHQGRYFQQFFEEEN